ncbi:hypothetical protein OBBRIDRAFT_594982 [Obba rivulosa]|uniref:Ubiquitin 3 binding protein But2 C-terminal domain-containing protein n=1 Tax=Obba rivulosa TaxID=1052685 RepID=A0A8E2AU98_9APHY|nr:hypothetical protein OBBRIDRAFT_594982 [Obba rivulosa]
MSYERLEPEAIPLVDSHDDPAWGASQPQPRRAPPSTREPTIERALLVAVCLVSLLSLAWNAVLFSSSSARTAGAHLQDAASTSTGARTDRVGVVDAATLRRPSLYQGLERVPEIKVQMQIEALRMQGHSTSAAEPARPTVRPAGGALRASAIARVNSRHPNARYPEDGWVLLTEEDRALLLFDRLPSSGSSSCAFSYTFPARKDLADKLLTIESDGVPGVAPLILITSLAVPDPLDLASMTWNTSPEPQTLLGAVPAVFGANGTAEAFECTQGGTMLVELACASKGCRVEYEDADGEPPLGIRLTRLTT